MHGKRAQHLCVVGILPAATEEPYGKAHSVLVVIFAHKSFVELLYQLFGEVCSEFRIAVYILASQNIGFEEVLIEFSHFVDVRFVGRLFLSNHHFVRITLCLRFKDRAAASPGQKGKANG